MAAIPPLRTYRTSRLSSLLLGALALTACGDDGTPASAMGDAGTQPGPLDGAVLDGSATSLPSGLTFASQVQPITRVADAKSGVFIPPFEECKAPKAGEPAGLAPNGQVCTNVMISACTEPGRYYPDYADCSVVRRQRPYWPAPPNKTPPTSDPRLNDAAYMADMKWVTEQLAASACTCCHDARVSPNNAASQWDIAAGPLWIDTLKDTGLGLFTGLADSTVLGAYPAKDNFGFDRSVVGIPTTDNARMQRIMLAELARRGLSQDWARALEPFGGPIYQNSVKKPEPCAAGQGVSPTGEVQWTGGTARYVYVLDVGGPNPGVPPNLDLPPTTVWRLDVLASADALKSGVAYGKTPAGTFQTFPKATAAAPLVQGKQYQLFVELDMGLPITNCTFTFGSAVAPVVVPDAGTPSTSDASVPSSDGGAGATCAKPGPSGETTGLGAACNTGGENPTECPCAASYCAKSPFDSVGYCTFTGCDANPALCPANYTCFDLSAIPGVPDPQHFCSRP